MLGNTTMEIKIANQVILRWGDNSALFRWAQSDHKDLYKGGRKERTIEIPA